MKELKGKAEFFQQYIIDRFNKLREQRSVATNTEESSPTVDAPVTEHTNFENLVENSDDAIAAKVFT